MLNKLGRHKDEKDDVSKLYPSIIRSGVYLERKLRCNTNSTCNDVDFVQKLRLL